MIPRLVPEILPCDGRAAAGEEQELGILGVRHHLIQILTEYEYDIIFGKIHEISVDSNIGSAARSPIFFNYHLQSSTNISTVLLLRSETVKCKVSAFSAIRNKCIPP